MTNCRTTLRGVTFEIDSKYLPLQVLGMGTYGVVCSAWNKETRQDVAIKKITNAFENSTMGRRTLREMHLLRRLKHENIISIKEIMQPIGKHTFTDVYIVLDLMDCDLNRIIRSSQRLSKIHIQCFMYQILCGLKYMHEGNILHRDLKPGNLLVNRNCDLKICDFGLARDRSDSGLFMTQYVQTRWYRAPELLLNAQEYGCAIDMWSVGCIFAELLGRNIIFPGENPIHQLKLIIETLGSPREEDLDFVQNKSAVKFVRTLPFKRPQSLAELYPQADYGAIDLLEKMLVFDPRKRITATEALQHPYITSYIKADLDLVLSPATPADAIDSEDEYLEENQLRAKVWNEMLFYHPEAQTIEA